MPTPSDFAYYEIYRSTNNPTGPFSLIGTSVTSNFDDTSTIIGDTYCYYIVAVDIYGNKSSPSAITCVFFSVLGPVAQVLPSPTAVFTKDNVVCVYRENDSDSYGYALRYKTLHGLDDDQLIAIPCSNVEILSDYIEFQDQVEIPLRTSLSTSPVSERTVYAMVLMPFVPGGFRDGSDVISSTSRLSRIFYTFNKNVVNPIYNKQIFNRFTGDYALHGLICTRIDGPNTVTKTWFDNIEAAKARVLADGKFCLDPYSAYTYSGSSDYTLALLDFYDNYFSRLGLAIAKTNQPPAGKDAFLPQIEDDSFFWGWGADRGSLSYFKTSTSTRAFFYNADFDGGISMRSLDARSWPILAVRQGYVATAGAMSGTNASGFLRPVPFMDTLFRGATLGEAFMYSQPLLDSSMACYGDPLTVFSFPVPFDNTELLDPIKGWKLMETCLAQSAICLERKATILKRARDRIAAGMEPTVQLELNAPMNRLYKLFDETSWKNDYVNVINKLIGFVVDKNSTSLPFFYPNLNQYLTYTNTKISQILLDGLQNQAFSDSIVSTNIETRGSWSFEAPLEHYPGDFRFYHIEIEVARQLEDFEENAIIFSKDTFEDVTNWTFEDYNSDFKPMNGNGITSNYEGRRIRYTSQSSELLTRGEFYWFRIRQKDDLEEFEWRYFRRIIFR